MRRFIVLSVLVLFAVSAFGCSKKQSAEEEAMSISGMPQEVVSPAAQTGTVSQTITTEAVVPAVQSAQVTEVKAEPPLPPSGPFKPTTQEIQTALKNAGFYTGEVDGKLGPKTRKAVEDFQTAHNLKADGKVGSQTWTVLQTFLTPAPAAGAKKGKKR